jgi:hypothetical protein
MLHRMVKLLAVWRRRSRQRRMTAPNIDAAVREARRDAGTNAAQYGEDQTLQRW